VIHVRVGEQNQVDLWEADEGNSRSDQALDAQRHGADMDAGAGAEDRVRDRGKPVDFQ
jgi:hypothetical protein